MPWYAVYTKSRFENKVLADLQQKNLETMLPRMLVWSKRKDRKKKISVPMFPGYVFVDMDTPDSRTMLSILTTTGVVRILGNREDGKPCCVPEKEIDAIKRLVSSHAEIQHSQYPQSGEAALIVDGPFQGIQGHVIKTDYAKEMFIISFEFLNRQVLVKLDGYQIRKV